MIDLSAEKDLTIEVVEGILFGNQEIKIDSKTKQKVKQSYEFLKGFAENKVIYGINTGLGPMAQYRIDDDKLVDLQYNLIRSHSAGAGQKIPDVYAKASMLVRMRAIMQGFSGIHPSCLELLETLINADVYPFLPEHGGVGASGDLVQLAHLALVLIGEGHVTYKGEFRLTKEVFKELNIKPIEVKLREGLSLINGTSVMTGVGLVNVIKAKQLLNWSLMASVMLNEIVMSFDDHFSVILNSVKKHEGQNKIAESMRLLLKDSELIARREDHFFSGNVDERIFKRKVQEYYSLRCVPQILGPVYEAVESAIKVVVNEANSVSDNPIVDVENENVYHGGNFHGDYVSLEMDKLKLAVTRVSMLSERQTAFLFNSKINEILPPFVNLGVLGLNLGMQGVQFTATSTTAENQTLSNSMYVHSITTNNDNQDIVSMGTNSALLTKKVIDNAYQVQAIEMMALIQAVDYLDASSKLSTSTKKVYDELRNIVPKFVEDTPFYEEIANVVDYLFNNNVEIPKE
ncbi:HAL/PAL/TAL family ammonia-lyase [Plebeiibacterium marinum]|uniref:Aromatic amino acid ammonia-lyase n=1 Tax=Plebeiibacterium marinum TaxID=2992111 RepID=A0AAE3MDY4_9BACT|nr:aromatic amino acid ammonia-lyase [Plebeiobacterium marinum]MCW3806038.1 aromatic amino acid ammonia-lyase [Plebeiobacterium marinum]